MNAKTNIALNTAVTVARHGKGIVHAAKAGWFTITLENGDSIKARLKDLSALGELRPGYVKAGICTYDPSRYVRHEVKTESGRKAFDIGDKVADRLRGKTLDEAYDAAAKVLGESTKALRAKYEHLNPGQQRMCLGNRMRHA